MTAGDVLHLDLSATGDDGLLVPFGKAKDDVNPVDEHNPLYAPPPVHPRTGLMRALFRNRRERTSQGDKPSPEQDDDDDRVGKKKETTFSFPNAPLEFAEEITPLNKPSRGQSENVDDSKAAVVVTPTTKQPDAEQESSDEDEDGNTSEEGREGKSENSREDVAPTKARDGLNSAPSSRFRDATNNTTVSTNPNVVSEEKRKLTTLQQDNDDDSRISRKIHMAGYGNSKPEEDTPLSAMSRMFRRIGRRSDMKSMKVATEDTRDERTFGEAVTHCLQVALVPEVYADDIEGEGNLGFYRPVGSSPRARTSEHRTSAHRIYENRTTFDHPVMKWKKENDALKARVIALRRRVLQLKEECKTKDLETMVWKKRAQEFEEKLRQYEDKEEEEDESNCEIDHDWSKEEEEKDNKESYPDKKEQARSKVAEEVLIDTTIVPRKVIFDPLEPNQDDGRKEQERVDQDDVGLLGLGEESEAENGSKKSSAEPSETEDESSFVDDSQQVGVPEAAENVLLDTNIAPEPVKFDPLEDYSNGGDAVASDDLFNLIVSLSSDVDASKTSQKESEVEQEHVAKYKRN